VALLGVAAAAGAQAPSLLRSEAFTLRSHDGRQRPAERIRLTVPAGGRDGRVIDLASIRLRPTGPARRPPIVFLMGGPGVPATVMAPIPPYFSRRGLARSEHVIVVNGGHELLPVPAVQDLVVAFLDGKPERQPIALPPPEVRTIDEARRPPSPRR